MLTEKPWRPEAVTQLLLGAILCFMVSALWLAMSADPQAPQAGGLRSLGATLTVQGAVVAMLWFFARRHALTLNDAFGLNLHAGRALLLGITVGLAFVPVALMLKAGVLQIANWCNIHLPEQSAVTLLRIADSLPERAALGFMAIVGAPIVEEGLFRGVLFTALRRFGFPNAALWISSLAFALIHLNVPIFVPLFVLAVVLAKLYERTGNLLACIACHSAFNAFNFIMLFKGEQLLDFFKRLLSIEP